MDLIARAPAVHTRRRSRWNPSAVDFSIAMGLRAARGTPRTMPILHAGEPVALVRGSADGKTAKVAPITWRQWCGFTGYSDLDSEIKNGKYVRGIFYKDMSGGSVQQSWTDMWPCGGMPAAGTFTGTANSLRAFSNLDTGALYLGGLTPGGSDTRHVVGVNFGFTGASIVSNILLIDRVATYESSTITTSTTTFTNTTAAPRYISSGQEGLLVSAFIQTTQGATAANLTTLTFTDQNGNTGVTAAPGAAVEWWTGSSPGGSTIPNPMVFTLGSGFPPRSCPWIGLAANCSGVRKLETSISSASNTGTFYWLLAHPVAAMWSLSGMTTRMDYARSTWTLERVFNDACISGLASQVTNANGSAQGYVELGHG